ncbi:MAG TPA: hypothetical protein DCF45_01840 [Gammaproteobacteria bacterium]|nr:hypothetical protein [Gammaproteobacteria bacterium]
MALLASVLFAKLASRRIHQDISWTTELLILYSLPVNVAGLGRLVVRLIALTTEFSILLVISTISQFVSPETPTLRTLIKIETV